MGVGLGVLTGLDVDGTTVAAGDGVDANDLKAIAVFKTAAFDRSATPPGQ